jgi:hypothetical protein
MGFWDSLRQRYKESEFKDMMDRLRKGKESIATKNLVETAGFWKAVEDKEKKTQTTQSQPQAQVKIYNPIYALILFVVGIGVWTFVYYYTPLGNIFTFFLQDIITKNLPASYQPLVLPLANFLWGYIILVAGFVYVVAHKFNPSSFPAFFQNIGILYLVAGLAFGIGYYGFIVVVSSGAFDSWICSGSLALSTVNKFDPRTAERCLSQGQQVPECTKNGIGAVEQISFGSTFTGQSVPSIYKDEIYTLPFTITNLDKDNILNDVYLSGKMIGQVRLTGGKGGATVEDRLVILVPTPCSKDNPCNVLPGSSQVVSLQSEDKIPYYSPGFADVTVTARFPYVGFGKGEVVIARSDSDVTKNAFTKPECGAGPVDVVVFFAPEYITLNSKLDHVRMFVAAINKGSSNTEVEATSILIKRIGSFTQLGSASCSVPGFNDTFSEGSKQDLSDLTFRTQAQFVCDIPINLRSPFPQQSGTNNNIPAPFVGIPFTATLEYNYLDTAKDSFPVVQN